MTSGDGLDGVLNKAFQEVVSILPAESCITCYNVDPSVEGNCFLRLRPQVDLGAKVEGAQTLFKPVKDIQPLSSLVLRGFCEGYNADGMGYPEGHARNGGWMCCRCGFYLSKEDSVDSNLTRLPEELRYCPRCGPDGFYGLGGVGMYAV